MKPNPGRVRKTTRILRRRRRPGEIATPRTTIRNHCLECMGYDGADVRRCTAPKCWAWPYRNGNTGPLDLADPRISPD